MERVEWREKFASESKVAIGNLTYALVSADHVWRDDGDYAVPEPITSVMNIMERGRPGDLPIGSC